MGASKLRVHIRTNTSSTNSHSLNITTSLIDALLNPNIRQSYIKVIIIITQLFLRINFIILKLNIFHYMYTQVSDTCTAVSSIITIVSFCDPKIPYTFWYIGSVLWKAWGWLNRVETCCHKNILCNKLLFLTEIYTFYESIWQFHSLCERYIIFLPVTNTQQIQILVWQ